MCHFSRLPQNVIFISSKRILEHFIFYWFTFLKILSTGLKNWLVCQLWELMKGKNVLCPLISCCHSSSWVSHNSNRTQQLSTEAVQMCKRTEDTQRWYFAWPLSFFTRWRANTWKKKSHLSILITVPWFWQGPLVCKGHWKRTIANPNTLMFKPGHFLNSPCLASQLHTQTCLHHLSPSPWLFPANLSS